MRSKHDSVALLDAARERPTAATPKKIGFVSLGCPKNLVDSEVMMGLLAQGGAEITPRAEDADIIVVNTCSFIDTAKQESVDTILEMAQHKTRRPRAEADRCRLPGRALSQRDPEEHSGGRRRGRHRRVGAESSMRSRNRTAPRNRTASDSPFVILNTPLRKATRAKLPGASPRDGWDGAIADLPNYLYDENTPRLLATPSIPPTSRSPKAATIPARSASFRSCAASFARAASSR